MSVTSQELFPESQSSGDFHLFTDNSLESSFNGTYVNDRLSTSYSSSNSRFSTPKSFQFNSNHFGEQLTRPIEGSARTASPIASAMSNTLSAGIAGAAAGLVNGVFSLGSSAITASAQRYTADKEYDLGLKSLSQQKMMWQKEYDVAGQLGLYSPSQVTSIVNNSSNPSDYYTLSGIGLTRTRRTKPGSVFGR